MFAHIKAISLDLDDTLWDIDSVIVRAEQRLHAWLAAHFPRITERHTLNSMREARIAIGARYPEIRHDLSEVRRRTLRWHAEQAGYPHADVEQGFDVYFAARNQVELYADVIPALETLTEHYPLIALTNGNADLQHIGLDRFFASTISSAAVKVSKPHPAMFDAASSRAGCSNAEVLHVGDDPVSDVQGARDAGAVSVWMNRNGTAWPDTHDQPDHEVENLHDLLELLGLASTRAEQSS
ncbi:MAG: HAD family hydrolase [Gammaproteobacteria bacterium]|nr:HAD family hydrolase [Gammaproteobacteria bacterium]